MAGNRLDGRSSPRLALGSRPSYGFRLIDSILKGDSRGFAKQISLSAMSRGLGNMATVCDHLSVEELEERYVGCQDATASRHFQVIWLLARGHTVSQVSATTAFGERWIEQLLARYNAEGPEALGDLRRHNGTSATILKPELLAKLRDRLREPPPDGGLWSSRKVANWMAGELGLTAVAPQRGWEALKAIGWSIQAPRPKNPKSASPEEAAAFKKSFRMQLPKRRQSTLASRLRSSPRTSTASA